MSNKILVTGASGNAGQEVLTALRASRPGADIRIATRHLSKTRTSESSEETVHLDFQKPDTFAAAVTNCQSVFLLRPSAISNTRETLNPLIDAARRSGVRRIVFLSVAGAADNKLVPHHAVEQKLREGTGDWTILRPGFFAQNIASEYRDDIMNDNRLYLPADDGQVAFIDLRDLGEVAADTLTNLSAHAETTYTLTGPESFTFYDVARFLSDQTGKSIHYEPASVPGYMYHLIARKKRGVMQATIQTILHTGLRYGRAETTDPTLGKLLNRAPYTVEDYIRDHAHVWT